MKVRKEFIIFGAIVVLFIVVIIAMTTRNSGIHYNGDNVILDFSDGTAEDPYLDDVDEEELPQIGDFSGLSAKEVEELERQARLEEERETYGDDELQEPGEEYRPTNTQPVVSQEPVGGDEPVESVEPTEEPVTGADVNEGDRPVSSMTAIQYANLMVYYVCGLEDSEFERWLTPELFSALGTQPEEPFISLRGNTGFSHITATDTSFSFTAKDGNTYAFNITFDGDRVSSVTPA